MAWSAKLLMKSAKFLTMGKGTSLGLKGTMYNVHSRENDAG